MNQTMKTGLSGQTLLHARPSTPSLCSRGASLKVQAGPKQASWVLDQPKRLWEAGSELWYPGAKPPPHLDASLPGDRGFDPLRLGEKFTIGDGQNNSNGLPWLVEAGDRGFDPLRLAKNFKNINGTDTDGVAWLVEGELYNGRIAMLATVGILAAELTGNGPWYTAVQRTQWPLGYWQLVTAGHLIYGPFEYSRWQNFRHKGETGLIVAPFDPLGLTNDRFRQNEVRNARLGMLAQLGFWVQAAQTHKSPIENLKEHIADPFNNNILTYPGGQAVASWLFAAGLGLLFLEAGNTAERESQGSSA
ncbi:hypothetical protein WJX73_001302 [Symbiochloris irregularis]|uniref:Chlorophyll a-b binding protein, chloroplastic n=1 Tax=Symbiochloris irregularis TaxID=706552 RepID=A0AAW1NZJ8_9CHLO